MGTLWKLPIKVNKSNGQLSSYIARNKLPKDIIKEIDSQPGAVKHLLFEFRGIGKD